MELALNEARRALDEGEVPVGAVVVWEGQVVGRGHNQVESLQDATAHAEMIALGAAMNSRGSARLDGCTLYVTLEPCTMCAGAIVLARLPRLVYGAADPKAGACGSVLDILRERRLNHRVDVIPAIQAEECGAILTAFFEQMRKKP
ncbi:MAG: nucleoside deaminase [Candidatus Eisenbacteria bacterium]|nr:nucleoside deaminase [Candidatus Eisenbacteria bacterium]